MVNASFEFSIKNTADATETITLTGGTSVTISGTATIARNEIRKFLAVVTNITSSSEAVTIYNPLVSFSHKKLDDCSIKEVNWVGSTSDIVSEIVQPFKSFTVIA